MKNILKKSIAILISACMLTSVAFSGVSAAEKASVEVSDDIIESGDYKYILLDDGTIEFCRPDYVMHENCGITEYEIPSQIDGYTVTKIHEKTFHHWKGLEKIIIPDTVTTIGDMAFWECSNLTSVEIPDSVIYIGPSAFRECTNLTSIEIPDSVTEINEWTFLLCLKLEKVQLPNNLIKIDSFAFSGCKALKSIEIPKNIEYIDGYVFSNCDSLKSVTIPDSITTIENNTFSSCDNLTDVTLPKNLTVIKSNAFEECRSLKNITIPESVTTVGQRAFLECDALKSIRIPAGVTEIGKYAFGYSYGGSTEMRMKDFCIYGLKYTAAEAYANEYSVIFKYLGYMGVDDIYFMDENVKPEINKITDGEVFDNVSSQLDNERLLAVYDIDFESEKEIAIKIQLRNPASKFYRVESDGTLSAIDDECYTGNLLTLLRSSSDTLALTTTKNDINSDGEMNVIDVTYLQMYLAGYGLTITDFNSDVNQDGKIDVTDVTKLQLVLAGVE